MKARWTVAALVLIAVAALVIILNGFHPLREPSYGGKSLSYWVEQIGSTNLHTQAVTAIQAVGPKGVPVLLEQMTRPEPYWRKLYRGMWLKLGSVRQYLPIPKDRWDTPDRICSALSYIGPPAIPSLIAAFSNTNKQVREVAASALIPMGPDASAAIPGLTKLVADPDPEVRFAAVLVLRYMGPERVEAVPALIGALKDDAIGIRRTHPLLVCEMAAQVLGMPTRQFPN